MARPTTMNPKGVATGKEGSRTLIQGGRGTSGV